MAVNLKDVPVIGVIGRGEPDARLEELAEEVGMWIAHRGAVLVNGGLDGVMKASARGCKRKGGLTIGFLPSTSRRDANPYIDIAIPTGMGDMRNILIVRASHGLIAVGGGYGTLSEIAIALKNGKPVVGLDTWDLPDITKARDPEEAVDVILKTIKDA